MEDVETAPIQTATDNCEIVFVDFAEFTNPGLCQNQVVINRRWIATDLCGNSTEHWQPITVFDDEAPVLQATPSDRTYECADEIPVAPVQTATDNCEIAYIDFAETTIPGECPNQ